MPGWLPSSTAQVFGGETVSREPGRPLTWVNAMSQRESARLARLEVQGAIDLLLAQAFAQGQLQRQRDRVHRRGWSRPAGARRIPDSAGFRSSAGAASRRRPSESMSRLSNGSWKSAMPPTTLRDWVFLQHPPPPAVAKPGPSKATSSSIAAPVGPILGSNLSVASRMRARASNAAGLIAERPIIQIAADGDAAVDHLAANQRLVQPAHGGRRHLVQDPELLRGRETRTASRFAAEVQRGGLPSPWKPSSARRSAPKSLALQPQAIEPRVHPGPARQSASVPLESHVHWLRAGHRPVHADRRRCNAHHATALVELILPGKARHAWPLAMGLQLQAARRSSTRASAHRGFR